MVYSPSTFKEMVTLLAVFLLAFAGQQGVAQGAKFIKMLPEDNDKSGYSIKIASEDGTDETNFNDNIRYTTSGAEARNTIDLKGDSKAEAFDQFGRIATTVLADLGLKPERSNKKNSATFAETSNALLEGGGWTFVPKSPEAFKALVGAVKFLGCYREGPVRGTVTNLKVVIVPLDLRFGHGQAAFLPRVKVAIYGSFKAGNSPFSIGPVNQDSSRIEKAVLITFRKHCFDDQAKAVEGLAETIQSDEGITAEGRKLVHANLLEWGKTIRSGKPKVQLLQELDKILKIVKPTAKPSTVEEMMRVGKYIYASASDIYLVNM